MTEQYQESACRPLPQYFCIECCYMDCGNLGQLEDGTKGCSIHFSKRAGVCQDFICWDGKYINDRELSFEEVHQLVADRLKNTRVPGLFKISEIYKELGF